MGPVMFQDLNQDNVKLVDESALLSEEGFVKGETNDKI
jgi:hypothetical protein